MTTARLRCLALRAQNQVSPLPGANKKSCTRARRSAFDEQPGSHSRRAIAILTERDRHLATIAGLRRRHGASNAFASKALTLLTRGWGLANWTTRADLLRTAAWLLQLQRLQDRI
jgi:hypothetical protein